MKRTLMLGLLVLLAPGITMASPKGQGKTFTGNISDSMCGLKHMMPGGAKECTIECVKNGSKYVLADPASGKVYELSDQKKPAEFAGEKVKVTGTLKGKVITVTSIEAAK
jgi:Protein of unknown function (DUF5818)